MEGEKGERELQTLSFSGPNVLENGSNQILKKNDFKQIDSNSKT